MNIFARRMALALLLSCGVSGAYAQCVTLNAVDVASTQNFDALATAGINNVLTLPGWQLLETGGGARDNEQYAADTGALNTGDTYSYGANAATDRALGSLRSGTLIATYGTCFTNNTGAPITQLDVAYIGEQWRLGTINRADRLDFQYSLDASDLATGTWTDVDTLDFSSPFIAGPVGARDGNDAANRTALAANIGLSIANGATVWIRWSDADATSADDGLAVDELSVTPHGIGGGGDPVLSISDTSAAEGDAGASPFFFTVGLNAAAGPGGVSFDYATADGTATAGSDYAAKTASANIPEGATSIVLSVDVNGDTDTEANETFVVDVSNITGAVAGDVQGTGTINNDDVTITAIHAIQGAGATSPLVGQTVTTEGIVTGRKSTGFFLQTADGEDDGNAATSQGIFVFTSSAPPASAAVGNRVQVSGAVSEFIPAADPGQLPLTELGGTIGVNLLNIGNPLPMPVPLTTSLPSPAGALDQLEPLEGMRVTADSFTVVAPTGGTTSEPNATGTTNGIFNVVVTGTPRPFREAGIQKPDAPPAGGSIPPIPQWDFNPELLTVVSRGIGGTAIDVAAGATIENFVGPLDYGFRRYTIVPDPAIVPTITPAPAPSAARLPTADEFTVASYNVERFFDTVNDPGTDDAVLTAPAFANRLNKASLAIRNFLNTPDIVGVVEMENLTALQALATKINNDAVAATQPNPNYVAFLQEGNDIGGIDVGFLVKTAEVTAGVDRVDVDAVTQLGKDEMWTQPDNTPALLNDRPPLQLDAVVHYADGRSFPITALVVHQRSLNGADEDTASGTRIRAKRQKQAEYLANQIQALQEAEPERNITVLGDFNAFEFNDGYVDAMNVVNGTPTPDNQTAVAGDGVDLVNPDLMNLFVEEPVDQRYSFVFDGNAQSLDHVLINQALGAHVGDFSLDHARINSDYPEVSRNDANSPSRLSDHDPAVAYFAVANADLAVTAEAAPASAAPGAQMTFDATVTNNGPNAAASVGIGFAFDAELADLDVAAPNGWTCDAPEVANGTTVVACSTATLANAASAAFELTAAAPANEAGHAINMAVLATSQTPDPAEDDNDAQAALNVSAVSDLSIALTGPSLLFRTSTNAVFVATSSTAGPDAASSPFVTLTINVPRARVSLPTPAGWTCVTLPTLNFQASCAANPGITAAAAFSMTITGVGQLGIPNIDVQAAVNASSTDPQPANNTAAKRTRVVGVTGY